MTTNCGTRGTMVTNLRRVTPSTRHTNAPFRGLHRRPWPRAQTPVIPLAAEEPRLPQTRCPASHENRCPSNTMRRHLDADQGEKDQIPRGVHGVQHTLSLTRDGRTVLFAAGNKHDLLLEERRHDLWTVHVLIRDLSSAIEARLEELFVVYIALVKSKRAIPSHL